MGSTKTTIKFKEINRLAIPAIFAGIVEPLISITDTAVAGRLQLDTVEVIAAIGLVGSFLSTLVWTFAQTRSVVSSYVSQAVGANKLKEIEPLVFQILIMNLLLSLLVVGSSYVFAEEIFRLYSARSTILDYCVQYFRIRIWGFPMTLITFTIFGIFRGLQNTSWSMVISLTGGILNIILDYIFAIVWDMHIWGIAYASLISQAVMLIISIVYLVRKTNLKFILTKHLHSKFPSAIVMTLNLVVRTISLNVALFLANRFATSYGDAYIDTHSILIQIWLLSAFILDGYSNAANAISGKLLGGRNYEHLWLLSEELIKKMLVFSVVLMLVYFALYNYMSDLFAPDQPAIHLLFTEVFWLVILMQPINSIAFLFDGIFKGLGEASLLRNVLLAATFLGFIPALLIFDRFDLKLIAVWLAFFVWMCVRAGGLFFIFRKKYYVRGVNK